VGFKLKTQIAGILFLLFTVTVAIIGYFNMSIVYDSLKQLSEEQSTTAAAGVANWVEKTLPGDGYSEQFLHLRMAQRADLNDYLGEMRNLRSFQILDPNGRLMWAWGRPNGFALHDEAVRQALGGHPYHTLWEYASSVDMIGRPLDDRSSLLLGDVALVYYRGVFGPNGVPLAVFRVTINVEEMPRRLRLMVIGNIVLSATFLLTAFIAISIWTANAINRPLEFILQGQERIGRGDFSAHVSVDLPSTNEIVSISTSFNRMAADLRRFKKELEVKTVRLEQLNNEYKRLNEHLESEVEDKTRELKEFFSVVTHDMKVPLAAIQGYADLLMLSNKNPLNEKQQRFVGAISSACSHLLGMTRNMLESVKYDAGKIAYYIEDFDLAELAGEVTTQIKQQAEEKGIRIWYDVPPLCREVQGDRMKMVQVLSNLVNNAVKFTPEGGAIEIRARDRGPLVSVEVTDSGVGISEDQLPHLFEKFTQFHTQEGAASSIGLGLYIVNKILEGHGQTIRVESAPGEGSTFTFTLAKSERIAKAESLDTIEGPPRARGEAGLVPIPVEADRAEGGAA
jgi:signal transduction histidine kinase